MTSWLTPWPEMRISVRKKAKENILMVKDKIIWGHSALPLLVRYSSAEKIRKPKRAN